MRFLLHLGGVSGRDDGCGNLNRGNMSDGRLGHWHGVGRRGEVGNGGDVAAVAAGGEVVGQEGWHLAKQARQN